MEERQFCITSMDETNPAWQEVTYNLASPFQHNNSSASNSTTAAARFRLKPAIPRDKACRTIQVEAGDSCASLASECGIAPADFTKYNPSPTLCGSLTPGQHVCCSAGTLPDFSPKPDANGYCYAYTVKKGDSCSSIAATYHITNDDIESYNKNTWGWNGCQKLLANHTICLSSGYPPMPAPVANAVCGPQVNGTPAVPPGTDLSTLNQCPLNACCNIWGQCGTTDEFCVPSNSSTGAPGTAAPGENDCISNCGRVISGSTSLLSATQTTTIVGGAIVWGSSTYIKPEQTETLGGSTTIIGGKTLPPTVITVTPNPHPTTVPSTVDPIVNPKTPKWTSGTTPSPTAKPGCDGCGLPCLLFCDSACPFCPPGVFPRPNGGGGGDDGEDEGSLTTTASRASYTILVDEMDDEGAYPTGFAGADDLASMSSLGISIVNSVLGRITSTTSAKPPPTSTAPPPPPPPPQPRWATDHGSRLHDEESGCGTMTGWDWHDATWTKYAQTSFNLPFFIKDGCVERAIVSAGGPQLSCTGHGLFDAKRSLEARGRHRIQAARPSYSQEQEKEFASFYGSYYYARPDYHRQLTWVEGWEAVTGK
ncbi:hypothetical protein VTK56DRAFT_3175 [Thermocarpiscus australiensis]